VPDRAWQTHEESLRRHFDQGDNPAKPWTWSTIIATCYVGAGKLLTGEVAEMRMNGALPEPPWDDEDEPNLLHQRYHLWRWQQNHFGMRIAGLQNIQEFGGGYGAMAVVASRLGFRGAYAIEDLRQFKRLQDEHLPYRGLRCDVIHERIRRPDLLISCFALDETPEEERAKFLEGMTPKSYLFAWNNGLSQPWFAAWAQAHYEKTGTAFRIEPGAIGSSITYMTSALVGR
jgi:hypothetical protein